MSLSHLIAANHRNRELRRRATAHARNSAVRRARRGTRGVETR